MPIPTPKKKENKKKYISRCIKFLKSEGRPKDQAAAICYTKWEKGDVSIQKLFERIDRIIGEEEHYLTKKQKKLPEKLKKKIIASKKKGKKGLSEELSMKELKDVQKKFMKKFGKVTVGISKGKKGLGLTVRTSDKKQYLKLPTTFMDIPVYKELRTDATME
jgi:hypothetical protein